MGKGKRLFFGLLGVNLIYACTSIFTKMASGQVFLSWPYILWIIGAVTVMGLYAMFWQRLLVQLPLSTAFMFKGTSLIFVLLISALLFGESITITNLIGSAIIVAGIILYAKA